MIRMKNICLGIMLLLGVSSCSDFLDTVPRGILTPENTWKTENDAEKFLIGCYDKWLNEHYILSWDATSDIGFANFARYTIRKVSNGSITAAYTEDDYANIYNFKNIRLCNELIDRIEDIPFSDEKKKNNIIGQAKVIRAFNYFLMNWEYGGVPIIENYETAEEAVVPRNTEEEVKKFVYDELDEAIPMLYEKPEARGRIAQGTALALKMRSALYYEDYERAKQAAEDIFKLKQYELEDVYSDLFMVEHQDSKEIICALQFINNLYPTKWSIKRYIYNNLDGGWSGCTPLQDLVDYYEMDNGLTVEEALNTGYYNPLHPYNHRDPRMAMTILFSGRDWDGNIYNTLDKEVQNEKGEVISNANYPTASDNSAQAGLTWAKYAGTGKNYYKDMGSCNACPIVFRYAEVLLSYAEAANELSEAPTSDIYDKIDEVRDRAGMPPVDREKYNTKEKLRELIRRERCVEFAGEGLRRADILRWKDSNGKMLAETLLNKTVTRVTGTVNMDKSIPEGERATVTGTANLDTRVFKPYHRYLPIPQSARDLNPKLTQNEGY